MGADSPLIVLGTLAVSAIILAVIVIRFAVLATRLRHAAEKARRKKSQLDRRTRA